MSMSPWVLHSGCGWVRCAQNMLVLAAALVIVAAVLAIVVGHVVDAGVVVSAELSMKHSSPCLQA